MSYRTKCKKIIAHLKTVLEHERTGDKVSCGAVKDIIDLYDEFEPGDSLLIKDKEGNCEMYVAVQTDPFTIEFMDSNFWIVDKNHFPATCPIDLINKFPHLTFSRGRCKHKVL